MKNYELTFLISPDLSDERSAQSRDKIISLIKEEEGVLLEANILLKRNLAYPIQGKSEAYLASILFQLSPEKLSGLEKRLKEEKEIMRYIILAERKRKAVSLVRRRKPIGITSLPAGETKTQEKKVELKEIEKKLEEILDESK